MRRALPGGALETLWGRDWGVGVWGCVWWGGWDTVAARDEVEGNYRGIGFHWVTGMPDGLVECSQPYASLSLAACFSAPAPSGAVVSDRGQLGGVAAGDACAVAGALTG